MSEMGDDFIEKGSNAEGNVHVDPPDEATTLHVKKFRVGSGNIIGKGFFKTSLLVPVLFPQWVALFFTELVTLQMLYLCS